MKILLASSEVHPYSKTGGLADMVGALGKMLARFGHQVGIVTPLYRGMREKFPELRRLDLPLELPLGTDLVRGEIWTLEPHVGLTCYFIDQPAFYQRASLYQQHGADYTDNAQRFAFLAKAAAHLALALPWQPEVFHAHDWQTALAPLLLSHQRRLAPAHRSPRTCLTVHNLAYQGVFPAGSFGLTNLPWEYFNPDGAEFYGQLSCLKAGMAFADVVTTVSPRYAREILTPEFGCGLDGFLRHRHPKLPGILNGVDYDEWRTEDNPFLTHSYSSRDLSGKSALKLELQQRLGLPAATEIPLFGSIGRLVEQKGFELMLGALEEMLEADLQFVLLGSGLPGLETAYQELAQRHPTKVAVRIGFDQVLSHQIEAGADFFLMPSRFEPCGLNQMYSLRYGTVPVVRQTGGLGDTVVDVRENAEKADGIKFDDYAGYALAKAIRKALALYQEPALLHRFRLNGMAADFSWERTAAEYLRLYTGG